MAGSLPEMESWDELSCPAAPSGRRGGNVPRELRRVLRPHAAPILGTAHVRAGS
ncbi:MAG TPA: hypothetical protein VNJ53_06230 [Gaiellaceae bacterium]|nr:hypothetical protein [Gaiellaceae bacterium]